MYKNYKKFYVNCTLFENNGDIGMEKLYIIGNGFDLHHRLPTSYYHYKKFLKRIEPEFVKRFDDFLERYVEPNEHISAEDIENWSSLESYTRYIYDFDLNEILEEAMASSEDDMDRASYWNDIPYMCDNYSEWINGIRTSFEKWIKTIEYHLDMKDSHLPIDKTAMYLTFNYTDTLEVIYGIPSRNVLHIHGDVSGEIIFGNNEMPEIVIENNSLNVDAHEDADWRISEASEILNAALEQTKLYYKDTLAQINKNREFFERICECEEIIIMGFSFGDEDEYYIDEIVNCISKLKRIKIYYRGRETIERFEDMFLAKLKNEILVECFEW